MNNLTLNKHFGPWEVQIQKDSGRPMQGILWLGSYEVVHVTGHSFSSIYEQLRSAVDPLALQKLFEELNQI